MRAHEFVTEKWTKKYKSSINCSNPKGFSQKAHCAGRNKSEDYDPNDPPPGPETPPTMPKGTVRVNVGDVYDWYKLGQHISNLKGLGKHDFGKGPPSTILSFGSEEEEHKYIQALKQTGLDTTDIDPVDPKQPKGMRRQKTDPTYNVGEASDLEEDLRKWFKEKWVRFGPDGKIRGDCAREKSSEGKPKCLPKNKAQALGKEGRAKAAARKRREDPNADRKGKAINVKTK